MATLRELKSRIGSVASSEKITGAMKMISSAKMHKAEGALRRLQPYRRQVETVIKSLLGSDAVFESPLIEKRDIKNYALIIWGSDDGLCGAYNANLAKMIPSTIGEALKNNRDVKITLLAVGSKMFKAARRYATGSLTVELVETANSKSEGNQVKDFLNILKDAFIAGKYDRIDLLYMQYFSASRQRASFNTLLPLDPSNFRVTDQTNSIDRQKSAGKKNADQHIHAKPYLFEPSAQDIFATAIPMFLLSVMEDVFTENRASEQAARVMAMQSANDNAKKLLDQLRLEYNKLRQQAITNELLDIVGGQIK